MPDAYPRLIQTVLDATDIRALVGFYRGLLGWPPRDGVEPAADDDWYVLVGPSGERLAFQQVDELPAATWPEGPVPQQLHLDFGVPSAAALADQHERVLALGARLLWDRFDDPEEPLRIYADPAGHPFCIFSTENW